MALAKLNIISEMYVSPCCKIKLEYTEIFWQPFKTMLFTFKLFESG